MENKGISTIIATLIIIGIVLVGASIFWVVTKNTLDGQSNNVKSMSQCVGVNLQITTVEACPASSTSCDVTVERGAGGGTISGIRAIVTDDLSTLSGDSSSTLEPLEMTTITATGTALDDAATKAKVAALVEDDSGNTIVCDVIDEYNY